MSTTITAVERANIFRFVLDNPQFRVATRIEELVTALRDMDEVACSMDDEMSRVERDYCRKVIGNARGLVARTTGGAT